LTSKFTSVATRFDSLTNVIPIPLLVEEMGTPIKLGGGVCHTKVCCCRMVGPQRSIVIGAGVCALEENAIETIVAAQNVMAAQVRI
jgi:hypothetical protein